MKKDISYKNLILGSAVYILCGLIIEYLICVFNILSNQEVAIKNIDPRLTDASDVVFILSLFINFGVFTCIFWSIFLILNRKRKFRSCRTFAISFAAIFINFYVSYAIAVDDNFIPYLIDSRLEFELIYQCTLINYAAFLIAMAVACLYVSIEKEQEPK